MAHNVLFSANTATAQAQEALTSAADVAARAKDPALAGGQYRYLATHACKGVALGISEDGERQEIILNPGTGEVIGERKVSDSMFADIPKGTVTSYSSVTTAVVDRIGAEPGR